MRSTTAIYLNGEKIVSIPVRIPAYLAQRIRRQLNITLTVAGGKDFYFYLDETLNLSDQLETVRQLR